MNVLLELNVHVAIVETWETDHCIRWYQLYDRISETAFVAFLYRNFVWIVWQRVPAPMIGLFQGQAVHVHEWCAQASRRK